MEFEIWFKQESGWYEEGFAIDYLSKEFNLAKAAYRAGLLHAAEQDDGISKQNEHFEQGYSAAYRYSAICHREAANDLK